MPDPTFHEVQMPPAISYGAVGGPGFHTTVLTLASGFEQRNMDWSKARAMYDVAAGLKTQRELNVLIAFFVARRGKAFGFRFKDWTDFRLPYWSQNPGDVDAIPVQMTTNGTLNSFQIVKVYSDIAGNYTRQIKKPVANSVILYDNGTPSTDFTVDTTTGIVTLGAITAATTGHLISVSCEFDVPVRFDTDDMKVTLEEYNSLSWGQITLVELKTA